MSIVGAMLRVISILLVLGALPASAVETLWDEGDLVGFPLLFDESGKRIGQGEFNQKREGSRLKVTSIYRFDDGRVATETATFDLAPNLVQKEWKFEERRGDALLRSYEVDLESGQARAEKHEGSKVRRKSSRVKVKAGRTFAGVGFVFAAKNLLKELNAGEVVELTAVAFTPTPRSVTVELRSGGDEALTSGATTVKGERIIIHPRIPRIARLVVKPRDFTLWFARRSPPQFLRSEATLAEPEEPLVQVNLFGSPSKIEP